MSQDDHISDETLTGYLDGALEDADMDRVAAALDRDPALCARLEALDMDFGEIRAAFDTMLPEAPKDLVLPPAAQPRPALLATAACALLAVGAGLGASFNASSAQDGWHDYVAAYQALYVEDTLTAVVQTDAQSAAQLQRVSAQLGRPLDRATDIPGFAYKRAQVLGFNGKPLIQMAYLTDTGVPMALCIIRSDEGETLETMRLEGLEAASWSDGDFAYLLIGGEDSAQIAAAATHLQAQL